MRSNPPRRRVKGEWEGEERMLRVHFKGHTPRWDEDLKASCSIPVGAG